MLSPCEVFDFSDTAVGTTDDVEGTKVVEHFAFRRGGNDRVSDGLSATLQR